MRGRQHNMIKRIWTLSDTHFGLKNGNVEWYNIQMGFFNKQFIPHVKANYRQGDILLIPGDVFDSRQNLNIFIMYGVISLFEKLAKIFKDGIYISIGNHDIYQKETNTINSLKCLRGIDNIYVAVDSPLTIKSDFGQKITLMPWNNTTEDELEVIKTIGSSDYLFCHTTIKGSMFNKKVKIEHGSDLDSFKAFRFIYSGHIHLSQKTKNFTYLGCPYEMDRNDSSNKKGFYLLDLETETEEFYENEVSPKHITLEIDQVNMKDVEKIVENNFVDVIVPGGLKNTNKFLELTKHLSESKRVVPIYVDEEHIKRLEENKKNVNLDIDINNMEILHLFDVYLDATEYNDSMKEKLKLFTTNLYNKAIKG